MLYCTVLRKARKSKICFSQNKICNITKRTFIVSNPTYNKHQLTPSISSSLSSKSESISVSPPDSQSFNIGFFFFECFPFCTIYQSNNYEKLYKFCLVSEKKFGERDSKRQIPMKSQIELNPLQTGNCYIIVSVYTKMYL